MCLNRTMNPTDTDVRLELDHLKKSGVLSPQECRLLERVVHYTLLGQVDQLYQKALADDLRIPNAKQIGVLATRIRMKLDEHYRAVHGALAIKIELPERGYEARFSYRDRPSGLSERSCLLVANAKTAIDHRTLPGAARALAFLDEGLRIDHDHPTLLSLKAYCYSTRALFGTLPRRDLLKAEAILEQIGPSAAHCWENWFARACVQMALHWDWDGARESFDRAIHLSGGEAKRQPWHCAYLASQGRAAEAIPLLELMVHRYHDSPIVRADLAAAQIYAGRYDDAEETIRTTMQLFGTRAHYLMWVYRAMLQEARGDAKAALSTLGDVPLKWPQTSITLGLRAYFSGLAGDRRSARRHFLKLQAARAVAGSFVPAGQLCAAAFGSGDVRAGVDWLRKGAVVERDPNLVLSNVYPFFRHLHDEPGFRAVVVDTMGLRLPS